MDQPQENRWSPSTTVASIMERHGLYLLVEEETANGIRLNQPAGHLEAGETLVAAVVRETLEETGCTIDPQGLVGVYRWEVPGGGPTYLRFCFHGHCVAHDPNLPLDVGIIRTHWLTFDEVVARRAELRSPMVLRCLEDYRAGRSWPLELITELE